MALYSRNSRLQFTLSLVRPFTRGNHRTNNLTPRIQIIEVTSDAFSVEVKCNAIKKKKKKLAEKSSSSAMESSNLVEWSSFFFFNLRKELLAVPPSLECLSWRRRAPRSQTPAALPAVCLGSAFGIHVCFSVLDALYFCLFEMPLIMETHHFTCSMTYKHQWPAVICRLPYSDTHFKF